MPEYLTDAEAMEAQERAADDVREDEARMTRTLDLADAMRRHAAEKDYAHATWWSPVLSRVDIAYFRSSHGEPQDDAPSASMQAYAKHYGWPDVLRVLADVMEESGVRG